MRGWVPRCSCGSAPAASRGQRHRGWGCGGTGDCSTGGGGCHPSQEPETVHRDPELRWDWRLRHKDRWGLGQSSLQELVTVALSLGLWHGSCGTGAQLRGCAQAGQWRSRGWAAAAPGAPPASPVCCRPEGSLLLGRCPALSPHTDPSSDLLWAAPAPLPCRESHPDTPAPHRPLGPQEFSAEPVLFNENECLQLGQTRFLSSWVCFSQLLKFPGTPGCSLGNMAISQRGVKAQLPPCSASWSRWPCNGGLRSTGSSYPSITPAWLCCCAASLWGSNGLSRLLPLTHILKRWMMMDPICQQSHHHESHTHTLSLLQLHPQPSSCTFAHPKHQLLVGLPSTDLGSCTESAPKKRCWAHPSTPRGAASGARLAACDQSWLWTLPTWPGWAQAPTAGVVVQPLSKHKCQIL